MRRLKLTKELKKELGLCRKFDKFIGITITDDQQRNFHLIQKYVDTRHRTFRSVWDHQYYNISDPLSDVEWLASELIELSTPWYKSSFTVEVWKGENQNHCDVFALAGFLAEAVAIYNTRKRDRNV